MSNRWLILERRHAEHFAKFGFESLVGNLAYICNGKSSEFECMCACMYARMYVCVHVCSCANFPVELSEDVDLGVPKNEAGAFSATRKRLLRTLPHSRL